MKNINTANTIVTVANGLELVSAIVSEVVGGEVSDSIQNQQLTRKVVYNYAQNIFANELSAKLGN